MEVTTALTDKAAQALRQSSIPALRRLVVEETGEVLVLGGRVSSYYLKQLAQETILPFLNGRELVNRIVVVRQEP